jgi:O-antigen ligase
LTTSIVQLAIPSLIRLLRQQSLLQVARAALFLGTLLLVWISLKPFADLSNASIDFGTGNDTGIYIWFSLLAIAVPTLAFSTDARGMATLATPTFMLLAGWMVLSVVLSQDPSTSLRRFVLTACVVATAATLLLLPRSRQELTRWLVTATLMVLALCYLGVLLAPGLSIHQASDLQEPHLAGDWRGIYGHKNAAAAMMVLFMFIGLYAARSGALISGLLIIGLTALFLVFCGGKSAAALLVLVMGVTSLMPLTSRLWTRAVLCLLPLVLANLLSVGTVISDGLATLARVLPFDTTFTGRTDVWRFAVESLARRPLTGYGFSAFWGSDLTTQPDASSEWAVEAAHSHNGYLDSALTMGLPGLVLLITVVVIGPLRNYAQAVDRGNGGPLAVLLLRIWLFAVYLATFESFFLDRADPIWFMLLLSVFGLHYLARFPTVETSPR